MGFPGSVDQNTGNRIRIVCEAGCVSLFLDRTVLQNQDGSSNLIQSTLVYGTQNPMKESWGASLMRHCTMSPDGLVFFLSERNKTMIQFSDGGLNDIPRQVNDRFLSAISKIDFKTAKMGIDPFFREVLISYGGGGLAYNYEQNAFQHSRTYSFGKEIEFWLTVGTRVYMLYQGKIYELNKTGPDGINRFFGLPFGATFTVVSNADMQAGKVYKRIRMKSQVPWEARVTTDGFTIQNGQNIPRETTVTVGEYEKVEDIFVASICQDINSGGKFRGLDMKGYLAEVQFYTDAPNTTSFEFVEIGYFESNIQKR
jgi:hypothetical protein